jgi:hypothetical protein
MLRWENDIGVDVTVIGLEIVDRIHVAESRENCEYNKDPLNSVSGEKFLD